MVGLGVFISEKIECFLGDLLGKDQGNPVMECMQLILYRQF